MLQLNDDPTRIDGASVLCQSLYKQGVRHMFGIVGIPVVEIGIHAQLNKIEFFGFRNEQSASYAAGIYGYLQQQPGIMLSVSGPGVVHCIAGLANAWSNAWPMVLISGASNNCFSYQGAFQEAPQMASVAPYVKFAAKPDSIDRIPFILEKAIRISRSGKPGPVYIELPGEMIVGTIPITNIPKMLSLTPIVKTQADPLQIQKSVKLLQSAKRPLVIVGKGMAYARAEHDVRQLIDTYKLPFLATPMGKGVVSDKHSCSVAAARSTALGQADVILLLGARLNWILHFGSAPRYDKNVQFIQVDIDGNEIGNNASSNTTGLIGDGGLVVQQLMQYMNNNNIKLNSNGEWKQWQQTLSSKIKKNSAGNDELMSDESVPMSYYRAYRDIREFITDDTIVVSEGANTMDIGRGLMLNTLPRHRLDAGTFGTMGVGIGFAIAAGILYNSPTTEDNQLPRKRIIAVEGDSGFGFSAIELETAVRYKLPMVIVVINNSGVYSGIDSDDQANKPGFEVAPTQLSTRTRYDELCVSLGGVGYFVTEPSQLKSTITRAINESESKKVPAVVNVIIQSSGQRKPQEHSWLTLPSSKL